MIIMDFRYTFMEGENSQSNMMILKNNILVLILMSLLILNSCTLLTDTLKVEVPKGFVGWCYVVPVKDGSVKSSRVVDGKYQIDTNGVVLISTAFFDVRKDHIVKVYEDGIDISSDMRYAGSVHRTKPMKYDYIHFFLPSIEERAIPDATQYWRDKMYEYRGEGDKKFVNLLKSGKIVY
jgi:hypothetical protein